MNKFLLSTGIAALMATAASAGIVTYDTNGSSLSCGSAINCTQNGATQVLLGPAGGPYLSLTYNPGSGTNVVAPSFINLGNITTSGTGSSLLATGISLSININATPPGSAAAINSGLITGSLSSNGSSALITFSPNNTVTSFGSLPGITIGPNTFQVTQTVLALQAPTVGNPLGQTTIQGAVSPTPEPGTMLLLSSGLIGIYMARKRKS